MLQLSVVSSKRDISLPRFREGASFWGRLFTAQRSVLRAVREDVISHSELAEPVICYLIAELPLAQGSTGKAPAGSPGRGRVLFCTSLERWFMQNINQANPWTARDDADLQLEVWLGETSEHAATFLCRPVDEVLRRAAELWLLWDGIGIGARAAPTTALSYLIAVFDAL